MFPSSQLLGHGVDTNGAFNHTESPSGIIGPNVQHVAKTYPTKTAASQKQVNISLQNFLSSFTRYVCTNFKNFYKIPLITIIRLITVVIVITYTFLSCHKVVTSEML